jgi:hypothetical protein
MALFVSRSQADPHSKASGDAPQYRSERTAGCDLKAFNSLHKEVDRFLRDTRSVVVVARLAELLGGYLDLLATYREAH